MNLVSQIDTSKMKWQDKLCLVLLFLVFLSHALPELTIMHYAVDKWLFIAFIISIVGFNLIDLLKYTLQKPILFFTGFCAVTFLVNGYYAINLDDFSYALKSIQFLLLVLFSIGVFILMKRDFRSTLSVVFLGGSLSLLITLTALFVIKEPVWRMPHALFVNQNQMARLGLFFSTFCLFVYQKKIIEIPYMLLSVILGVSMLICYVPASRAGMIGIALLWVISLFIDWKISIIGLLTFALLSGLFMLKSDNNIDKQTSVIEARFEEDSKEDSVFGRGYNRIYNNPKYVIFGAGESGIDRWDKIWGESIEIHSTLGNILFCYGFLGLLLFVLYLFNCISVIELSLLIFAPVFVHSLVHNDIRNIYFLLFPILVYFAQQNNQKTGLQNQNI